MKRGKHRLATALSTLVFLAAGLMWVRSMFRQDQVRFSLSDLRLCLGSSSQRLWVKGGIGLGDSAAVDSEFGQTGVDPPQREQLLPACRKSLLTRTLLIPYWFIVLPASILPLMALYGKRGRGGPAVGSAANRVRRRRRRGGPAGRR